METRKQAYFKCPNCKGHGQFKIVETMVHTYASDNNDEWGGEIDMDSLRTEVTCGRCGKEIDYNPDKM